MAAKTKKCIRCLRILPATVDNFRRDARTHDGYSIYCKDCVKEMQRDPNREYYNRTVERKGVLGWRCPLWTERCGECRIINTCWRIANDKVADLPVKLVGLRRKKKE
jgi:hypothetical protein